jgi:hypothetical protein
MQVVVAVALTQAVLVEQPERAGVEPVEVRTLLVLLEQPTVVAVAVEPVVVPPLQVLPVALAVPASSLSATRLQARRTLWRQPGFHSPTP